MLVKRLAGLFVLVVLAVLAFQTPRVAAVSSGPVDMKLLVITGDGSEPSFSAATVYLDRIGIPHDVLIATDTTLTPSLLGDGSKGYYQGIVLATGTLSYEPQLAPPVFKSRLGDGTYARRKDLVPDGVINILDLVQFTPPTFNTLCM